MPVIAVEEIDWLRIDPSKDFPANLLGWYSCDFCNECYMEDVWAGKPIRQFYRLLDGGEIACEHCLPDVEMPS